MVNLDPDALYRSAQLN